MKTALVLSICCILAVSSRVSYEGYKVFEIEPKNIAEVNILNVLEKSNDLDFWTKVNRLGKPTHVMVKPDALEKFEALLNLHKFSHKILIDNVETGFEAERQYHLSRKSRPSGRISFDQYYRHGEINAYLEQLERDYPDLVSTTVIGKSTEGRNLTLIEITSSPSTPNKTIFIDAGIHAREWIAPAVALYIINQLVENSENAALSEKVQWVILPSLNPDGYEYSWDEDRMWRKTRSVGDDCDGVDANRNFGFHWMESGASDWQCSETYAGPEPYSEPEAQALRDYLLAKDNVKLYLTLHSYGPYLLYPWGFADVLPDNWQELDDLGNAVANVIEAEDSTTEYEVGSSTRVLYAAAGASDDWSMGEAGVQLVYTMELPGGGSWGFDLPPREIQRVVSSTWDGIKFFQKYVEENTD